MVGYNRYDVYVAANAFCGGHRSWKAAVIAMRNHYNEALLLYLARTARVSWVRWSWTWREYRDPMPKIIAHVRLVHRRLMFHMSGWLLKTGKAMRGGV